MPSKIIIPGAREIVVSVRHLSNTPHAPQILPGMILEHKARIQSSTQLDVPTQKEKKEKKREGNKKKEKKIEKRKDLLF